MSMAWIWVSGNRNDWRRRRPVSILRSPSSIRQRVTSHEITPITITMPRKGNRPMILPRPP